MNYFKLEGYHNEINSDIAINKANGDVDVS
jgi:hypothetical protein